MEIKELLDLYRKADLTDNFGHYTFKKVNLKLFRQIDGPLPS